MKDLPQQLQLGLELGRDISDAQEGPMRYEPGLSDEEIEATTILLYAQMDLYIQASTAGTEKIYEVNQGSMEMYREALVGQEFFPLSQDLELSSLPPAVKGWLQQLFSEEAQLLYKIHLAPLTEVQLPEEATISDMKHKLMVTPRPSQETYRMKEFIQRRENEIQAQKIVKQAEEAKVVLQDHLRGTEVSLDGLTPSQLVELHTRIKEGANTFQEVVYFLQLITQAADVLSQVAPSLRDDLLELLPTILLQGEFTSYNGKIQTKPGVRFIDPSAMPWPSFMKSWSMEQVSGISRLTVDLKAKSAPDTYPVWLLIAAHELLHILTVHYVHKHTYDSLHKPSEDIEEVGGSLFIVILEAISLAGEYLVYQELQKTNLTQSEKELLASYSEFRYSYLRYASKAWHEIRKAFKGVANDSMNGEVKYREGMSLAIAWRNRGWELNDLESLVKELTFQCNNNPSIGIESLADFKGIAIQRHLAGPEKFNNLTGESTYQSVLSFLKSVQKPS